MAVGAGAGAAAAACCWAVALCCAAVALCCSAVAACCWAVAACCCCVAEVDAEAAAAVLLPTITAVRRAVLRLTPAIASASGTNSQRNDIEKDQQGEPGHGSDNLR